MGYWLAKFIFVGPFLRLIWRPWATGLSNIPDDRPAIIVSNHLSFCDSFFMPLMVPRKVTFLAKAEYFTTPGIKGFFSRFFFSAVGQVPIDRDDKDKARAAITTAVRVLGEAPGNNLLGIYPEGTRSPDGRLYRGKTGVARMALASGAVVVPVVMVNTDTIQPSGRVFPRFRPRPGSRFGTPMDFSRYEGMIGDRNVERAITDEIMYALMEMSGQEYVDEYAADVKKKHGSARAFGDNVRQLTHRDRRPDTRAS